MNNTISYLYFRYKYDLVRIEAPKKAAIRNFSDRTEDRINLVLHVEPDVVWKYHFDEHNIVVDNNAKWLKDFAPDQSSDLGWTKVEAYAWLDNDKNSFHEHRIPNYFATTPKFAKELCTNQFEPLLKYFGALTTPDLRSLNEDELVKHVESHDKIIMMAFYRNVLKPLIATSRTKTDLVPSFKPTKRLAEDNSEEIRIVKNAERMVIDLKRKVISKMFAGVDKSRIPANDLRQKVLEHVDPSDKYDIDISRCQLNDVDMKYVVELVDSFPQCTRLDLSLNQFIGIPNPDIDAYLKYLLSKETIDYIDITYNPIGSDDRKDLLEDLEAHQFSKLIWIPSNAVEGVCWHYLVPSNMHEIIYSAHLKYYNSIRKT